MSAILIFSGACALLLAFIHLWAGKLRFLNVVPRSRWLSLAGGASVGYVFVHLLPELAAHQLVLQKAAGTAWAFLEHHVYLVALCGLSVFYGLERLVLGARRRTAGAEPTQPGVFWLHIGSFALYNLLIGYLLLHRETSGWRNLGLYVIAMALHFVVNDFGLREQHKEAYQRQGRWCLAVAVLLGWGVGVVTEISAVLLAALIAFLAGGVILNVLKEELPAERESRFWAFALGALSYAALLLTMR